ncbi:alpha/beta hydrolase [Kosakonia sp. BYX6]|uniref:Alpha/beta hydrolase n=1 Tax=Kosakonia calanthes TaxID=3139408 RepID=A0ABZ3B1F4_9ENTR
MQISVGDIGLWFDVDGAKLVAENGKLAERNTVIVLHGGPGFDHGYLKPEMQRLAENAQVIFIDQRGQGRSDTGDQADWCLDQWADDVAAFCEVLNIQKPILLGTSFGGFVALATAVRHPELASGLIIVSSAAHIERDAVINRFGELGGEAAANAANALFSSMNETSIAQFTQHCIPLYSRKDAVGMMTKLGQSIMRLELQAHFFSPDGEMGRFDYRAGLRSCRVPTLMLHGELDPIIPTRFAKETALCFPKGVAQLITYPGCAHDLVSDCWGDIHAEMTRFITDLNAW